MRRADRLFQLVRGRRLSTAAYLTERLAVTSRTIYRDVADLQHQGVPIEGEAGVGYRLGSGFDLPPLMFTQDEAKSLVVAVRVAQIGLDAAWRQALKQHLAKFCLCCPLLSEPLPKARLSMRRRAASPGLAASRASACKTCAKPFKRNANCKSPLKTHKTKPASAPSAHWAAFIGGKAWTLAAWCETKADFRNFRVDRIQSCEVLEVGFHHEPGKTLADFLRKVGAAPKVGSNVNTLLPGQ